MEFDENDPEQREILALRLQNAERIRAIAETHGVMLPVGQARQESVLEEILDAVLPPTNPRRITFERTWAEEVKVQLDETESMIRRAVLQAPAQT